MERVLSIDVATKTLALCLLDVDADSRVRIVSWEVVDCYAECAETGVFVAPKKPSIGDSVVALSLAMKQRALKGCFDTVSRVVIEQQPSVRFPVSNPRSKYFGVA